jgi:hypothetical protein
MTTSRGAGSPAGQAAGEMPAHEEDQVRQEIEHDREKLGATVAALAAKADIPARAHARAAELTGRAKTVAQRTAARGAGVARQQPVPLAAAAIALIAGYLAVHWWRAR